MSTLSGQITLGGREAASTATVELRNKTGDIVDQVRVDDDGRFVYHLSPGRWQLNVWDALGHRGKVDVTLGEGEDKALEVDLEKPEGSDG